MRKAYQHLCEKDRGVIYRMNKAGKTQIEIAKAIGFSQSTVSKELRRNCGKKGYRSKQAQQLAAKRKESKSHRSVLIIGLLQSDVEHRIRLKHSPEQISGALKLEGVLISHETIYKHIAIDKLNSGDLHSHLRINGKRRYRKRVKIGLVGKIPDRVDIDKRPKIVEDRKRYGDWEVDLIEGAKGSGFILSLYERKSRLGKLVKLENKTAELTAAEMIKVLDGYKVRTITYDNGLEFAEHGVVAAALRCKNYFCKPYHSWEKGGVENFNGLVRQYFSKRSSFRDITAQKLAAVEQEINERPRKSLGYKSPSNLAKKIAA